MKKETNIYYIKDIIKEAILQPLKYDFDL